MAYEKGRIDIRYVDWGVANNFGNYIEVHKDLLKYPKLLRPILEHELKHTNKVFSFHDLKHDLTPSGAKWGTLFKFMIARPKTWIQVLPFYWQKGKGFIWDLNLIIVYAVVLCIIGGLIWLWLT